MTLSSRVSRFRAEIDTRVSNSKREWTEREGLIFVAELRGTTRRGASLERGFGEASPLPGYSAESIEQCEACLRDVQLFDSSELSLSSIERLIESMPTLPAARFAVETALLDLLAQKRGQPVASLFGKYATRARKCALLDRNAPLRSATQAVARGITCMKLKVGGEWAEEFATIRSLRKGFPDVALRLDVNAAWTLPEAKMRLSLLEGLGIQFVEQPVAPGVMARLVDSPVPIAADESLHSEAGRSALEPLLTAGGLRAVVLKPTVLGGFFACLKLEQWARRHKVIAIASHCFEGPVGTAAVAELALALDAPIAAGVDEHAMLATMSPVSVPQLQSKHVQLHHGGLGVVLEP